MVKNKNLIKIVDTSFKNKKYTRIAKYLKDNKRVMIFLVGVVAINILCFLSMGIKLAAIKSVFTSIF